MFGFLELINVEDNELVVIEVSFLLINTYEEVQLIIRIRQVSWYH